MNRKWYAGYNSYGIRVVGYHAIHVFDTRAARDAWVNEQDESTGNLTRESVTAKTAYNAAPSLQGGTGGCVVIEH